jgi:hypothetical protein
MEHEYNPPVFHTVSLFLNIAAVLFATYLYGGFYEIDGHKLMDGMQFVLLSVLCFGISGISAVIGFARRERLNLATKISSVAAIILGVVFVAGG